MVSEEIRRGRLMALVHGLGQIVFNYGRPFALNFTDVTVDGVRDWVVPILYFDDLYNLYIRQGVCVVKVKVNCVVCDQQFRIGGWEGDLDKAGNGYYVQQFMVPATGHDGMTWIWTKGPCSGQPRRQHVLVCKSCADLGMKFSAATVRSVNLLPNFLGWGKCENLFEGDFEDDVKKSD